MPGAFSFVARPAACFLSFLWGPPVRQRGRRGFPQRGLINVRFAPKATEVLRCCEPLFDHLVGEREQSVRNLEAECLRGFEIDD